MRFEWDEAKAASNERKHGVSFEVAATVFADRNCLICDEHFIDGEQRWQAIGSSRGALLLLTVVHTYRDNEQTIRIISARRATRKESTLYVENFE